MEKAWDLFWQTGKITDYLNCCHMAEAQEDKGKEEAGQKRPEHGYDDSQTEGTNNGYVTAGSADRYGAYFHADRGI